MLDFAILYALIARIVYSQFDSRMGARSRNECVLDPQNDQNTINYLPLL